MLKFRINLHQGCYFIFMTIKFNNTYTNKITLKYLSRSLLTFAFLFGLSLTGYIASPAFSQSKIEEGVFNSKNGAKLNVDDLPPVNKLFNSSDLLKVSIETNTARLYFDKENPEYQKAVFRMRINDSISIVKKIRIKIRGNTRVQICDTPPFKIDFHKTDFKWKWFNKLHTLKVVNTCGNGKTFQNYLLSEYLIYKTYNELTNMSYRVRLLELTLKDSKHVEDDQVHFAFLIESDKILAKRTDTKELESEDITIAQLMQIFYTDPNKSSLFNTNLLSLFQYMIGNTDWGSCNFHNVKVFEHAGVYSPVPYDFDYSGMVNADYAVPTNSLLIKSVRERYYLGPCSESNEFNKALEVLKSKKSEIYSVVEAFPYIRSKEKEKIIKYFDSFFNMIDNPQSLMEMAMTNCPD